MILIGADPEVFVINKSTGNIVPSTGLIGGNKHSPRKVERGALQEDNVMGEFNIDPASSFGEFQDNINHVLKQLDDVLVVSGHTYDKTFKTTHEFDKAYLKHPQALQFGCDPDDNAYSMLRNETINPKQVGNFRMCGGHIHIGFDNPDMHPMLRLLAVRWMDVLVGGPLAAIDPDKTRNKFYGKAGNYRIKPYGVEYRTVSNFWLSDQALIRFVYDQTILAATRAEQLNEIAPSRGLYSPQDIRRIIDTPRDGELLEMLRRFGAVVPKIIKKVSNK